MLVRPVRRFPGTALMYTGTAISQIWPLVFVITAVAEVLTWQHEAWALDRVSLTPLPFSLIGLALSIFLGFRNNACYDRWWEARKLWGALINTTRTLARQTLTLVDRGEVDGGAEGVSAEQREQVRRVIAYTYALKDHLRQQEPWAELAPWLPAEEVEALKSQRNVPVAILRTLGAGYSDAHRGGRVHPMHLPVLEESLTTLTNIQGGCERIKNTPVPLSYTVLTHRIVGLYCLTLPFGIIAQVGDLTPVVVALISFAFLGLDAVGSQIEDPFELDANDLPLSALARIIEVDLLQTVGETQLPDAISPEDGVLL